MRFWLVVLTATLFSAGCFDHRYVINLSTSAKFDHASNDGVVVLKAPLATYTISAGHADRDGWARVAQWREHQINPVDGYVVLRLPPRTAADSYGIVAIRPANDASPLSTKNYEVDRGQFPNQFPNRG